MTTREKSSDPAAASLDPLTDSPSGVGARALAEQIVAAVADVSGEDVCECGSLLRDHKYWEDRVYDVNGYRCQKSATGSDYRHSVTQTARHLRARQIAAASYVLNSVGARAPIEPLLEYVQHKPSCESGKGIERYTTGQWRAYACTCGLDDLLASRSGPAQNDEQPCPNCGNEVRTQAGYLNCECPAGPAQKDAPEPETEKRKS